MDKMFILKDQYGKVSTIFDFDQFRNFVESIPDDRWSSGSGDICLLNNQNGYYVSISKIKQKNRFIMTSSKKAGEELYVYVASQMYTALEEYYVGGELMKFPAEFFVEKDFILNIVNDFMGKGSIDFSGNWVVLHEQEWLGLEDD
ncbi:hypothetical protein [Acinetobacter nematophilus]|uniref:Uncharacterized protein n=1 Tax=Acinetobacter nematophilus TaxID=2994642 RepID=A0A9X3DVX5_9GAMM|nr:hypothetical protein [Acinetobacter nematophilus]MCX5469096.1 hypothetical protein [Acinetobacter nematophilus]